MFDVLTIGTSHSGILRTAGNRRQIFEHTCFGHSAVLLFCIMPTAAIMTMLGYGGVTSNVSDFAQVFFRLPDKYNGVEA